MPRLFLDAPNFSEQFVKVVSHWIAGRLGLPREGFDGLMIVAGRRRYQKGQGSWGGAYRHADRTVRVLMPRIPIAYPQSLARNRAEAGRKAMDGVELFVWIQGHELVHSMASHVAETPEELVDMNHEPRVRNASWDLLVAFRHERPAMYFNSEGAITR